MRDVSTRKSGSDCRLTVVTPMYNEGECIRNNISRIVSVLEGMGVSWEYILVDDGSTDDSYARAREAMAGCPNCRLVGYARNRGRGYALRQGIDAARGDYVVTTESDLSWGEEIIPQLYEALASGTDDMVIASINQDGGGFENVPPFRKLLSRLGNRVFRLCYGGDITMFSGMTRGYRREAIQSLHLEENGKPFHLEVVSKAQALRFRISEIPARIRWDDSPRGRSWSSQLKMVRHIMSHLSHSFNEGGLRIIWAVSMVLFFLGSLLVTFGVLNKLFELTSTPKPNMVIYGLFMVFFAVLSSMIGMLSLQTTHLKRHVIHLQSQVKDLKSLLLKQSGAEEEDRPHPGSDR